MITPIHEPGPSPARYNGVYTRTQDAKWHILDDFVHAFSYGFSHCRMPTPGTTLSEEQISGRMNQIMKRWNEESGRDLTRRPLEIDEVPENLQQWFVEALIPYPSTDIPTAGMPRR